VALLVVACGGDAVGEVNDEPPGLGPLVEERELWRSTDADAISVVSGASLHGGTAVLLGGGKDGPGLTASSPERPSSGGFRRHSPTSL
jgi:hypothetical protein